MKSKNTLQNKQALLVRKIKNREAVVGIIGIGYVGGALAKGAAQAGFKVIGMTRTEARAKSANDLQIKNYTATTDFSKIIECDIICICVPTPIHNDKTPDLDPLENALRKTAQYLKSGTLIIIESTVAPGTTRQFALPILEISKLISEVDFFLAFSPERVDPGNKNFGIHNTPRVVSGLSTLSNNLACQFYRSFVETVVPVSSLESAEMSKILENTFRLINISLMNEMQNYTKALGIDLWEVIHASSTKPYGFMPHYPGPGVGGHCIPVDPYYLLSDAKNRGIKLGILEQAGIVNDMQPTKVVKRTLDIIKQTNGHKKNYSVLLIGLSYKEDIEDKRESSSLRIWELLQQKHIEVSYHDPYTPQLNNVYSLELTQNSVMDKDVIIIATPHSSVDYSSLVSYNRPILDTRNVLKDYKSANVYRI